MQARILLIDDDPNITFSLRRILRKEKFWTREAHSPLEARQILNEHSIDVIVCDEKMPEMNGTEFLYRVRQRFPDTIRIILTGHASMETAIKAINEGQIFRFLIKPCNPQELMATIRQGLNHRALFGRSKTLLDVVKRQSHVLNSLEQQYPGIIRSCWENNDVVDVESEESKDFDQILREIDRAISSVPRDLW